MPHLAKDAGWAPGAGGQAWPSVVGTRRGGAGGPAPITAPAALKPGSTLCSHSLGGPGRRPLPPAPLRLALPNFSKKKSLRGSERSGSEALRLDLASGAAHVPSLGGPRFSDGNKRHGSRPRLARVLSFAFIFREVTSKPPRLTGDSTSANISPILLPFSIF